MADIKAERNQGSEERWKLDLGAEYDSFEEFELDLKKFSDHNNMLFVIDKSVKIDLGHRQRVSNTDKQFPESFVYKYVRYRCKQGGRRRYEGRGIRPHQRSFKLSCGAFLVLAADRKRGKLSVTHFSTEHNHEVSEAVYKNYPEIRRLNHPHKQIGEIFLGLKVDQTKDRGYLQEFSGKRLTMNDFHNLSKCVDMPCLQEEQIFSTIENLFEEDREAAVIFSIKDNTLEYLYAQRSSVKLLEAFSDFLSIDIVHKPKGKIMPILSIMIIDNMSQTQVIAQALIENTETEIISAVLETFKSENEKISSSLCINNLIQSYEERIDYKSFLDKTTVSYNATKLVKDLRDVSTDYAFEIMVDELKQSETMTADINVKDSGNYEVIDNASYDITIKPNYVSCSCNFNSNTNLPCRHIFYLVSEKRVCSFSKEWIPMKWQICPQTTVKPRPNKVKNPIEIDVIPPEKVKKMRTKGKYIHMLNVMKLLANLNSTLSPKEYSLRFEVLVLLHKLWQDGKRVTIQENAGNMKCQEMNKLFQNMASMSSLLGAKEYKDRYDLVLKLQAYWEEGKKVSIVENGEIGNSIDKKCDNTNFSNKKDIAFDSTILSDLGNTDVSSEENDIMSVKSMKSPIKDVSIISQPMSVSQLVKNPETVINPVCNKSKISQSVTSSKSVMMQSKVANRDVMRAPYHMPAKDETFITCTNFSLERKKDEQDHFSDSMVIYLEPNSIPDMRPAVQVVIPPPSGMDDITLKMEVDDPPSLTRRFTSEHNEVSQPCLQFLFSQEPNQKEIKNVRQFRVLSKRKGCARKEITKRRRINEEYDLTARVAEVNRFISNQSDTEIQDLLTTSLSFNYTKVQDTEELKHRCRYNAVLSLVDEMQQISQGRLLEMVIVAVIQRCKILNVNPNKSTTAYVLGASLLLYSYIHNLKPTQAILTLKPLAVHQMSSPHPLVYSEDIHIAVGNTTVTQQSLDTLSPGEHLDDQVIYAYLGLQAKLRNVGEAKEIFIFPSQLANVWETGQFGNWLFRNVDICAFRWLFMPIKAEKHWFLLVANVRNETLTLLDSSFNAERQRKYFYLWINYMVERDKALGPTGIKWQTCHMQSTQQEEDHNSGIFVLMNADALLYNVPTMIMRNCHANNYRNFVLNQLLKYGHPVGKTIS